MCGLFLLQRAQVVGKRKWRANPLLLLDWCAGILFYLLVLGGGLNLTHKYRPEIAHDLLSLSPWLRNTLVVAGAFALSFAYSHFATGGMLQQIINGISLDWDLSRNVLYLFAILPPLIAIPLVFAYPGAIAGLSFQIGIFLVAWKWTDNSPSGAFKTMRSLLTLRRAAS
jgi:hypothetical protein